MAKHTLVHSTKREPPRPRKRAYLKIILSGFVAAGLIMVILDSQQQRWDTSDPLSLAELQQVQSGFPFFFSEEEARPFPKTLASNLFTGYVRRAYRVAEEMPGVVAQQPCFCECRSSGHTSLLFCYSVRHAAG